MSKPHLSEIRSLQAQHAEALRLGDRARAGEILKKLRDLLVSVVGGEDGKIDPEDLQKWIRLIGGLLTGGAIPATAGDAQALGVSDVLTVGEAQAAGILDNPQLWIQLITLLFEFIRQLRGDDA